MIVGFWIAKKYLKVNSIHSYHRGLKKKHNETSRKIIYLREGGFPGIL